MSRLDSSVSVQQAGLCLRRLLLKQPYRSAWVRYERQRERHDDVHQKAVVEVLKRFIDRHRDDERYRDVSLSSLPQRVSRALRGEVLSTTTIQLFADAFQIHEDDAACVWRLYEGTEKIRLLIGASAVAPEKAAALVLGKYRTRSVQEHHYLGQDGLPAWHHTQQVIEATADQLDRYSYRFDTNALTVEVQEGGTPAGPVYHVQDEVYAVDILLDEPLSLGEAAPLSYLTLFHYEQAPKCEFRRAARRRIEDIGIRVEFHPSKLPQAVWWAVWDGIDGEITEREAFRLRAGKYVYRHLDSIENTVVGFTWEW